MSLETFRQAVPKFFQAREAIHFENTNIALIVAAVSLLVCLALIVDILRVKAKGATLKAQLISSFEDLAAYSGALVSTILVTQGHSLADPIASIIVAILIALSGVYLFIENVTYLPGKAPSRELVEKEEKEPRGLGGGKYKGERGNGGANLLYFLCLLTNRFILARASSISAKEVA